MIRAILLGLLLPWSIPVASEAWAEGNRTEGLVQGNGTKVSQTRKFEAFTAIELRIPADMHVTIGKGKPLTIETDDNIMPLIKMEVRKGKLVISSDRKFKTDSAPEIKVTVAKLRAVEVVGAGDMWVTELDNASLSVVATGAADVHLSGKTKQLALVATGASDVFAYGLDVQAANVTLTGPADAKLSVSGSLNVMITGAGDVHYRGNPTLSKVIVGDGEVKQVHAKHDL